MPVLATTFFISAGSLVLLVLLFIAEDRRGQRIFLRRPRALFDLALFRVGDGLAWLLRRFGASALRRALHRGVHFLLRGLLATVEAVSFLLRRLQRTNKNLAESIAAADARGDLWEVGEHAASIKLSPEARAKKRRDLLE
jgi:hypothetical protein